MPYSACGTAGHMQVCETMSNAQAWKGKCAVVACKLNGERGKRVWSQSLMIAGSMPNVPVPGDARGGMIEHPRKALSFSMSKGGVHKVVHGAR
jgi:hypothetical protein